MANNVYDAIIIGSGISGGWAAKELTEKGLKTVMLERGRNIEHIKDYPSATKHPWEFPHRNRRTLQMIKDYPILNRDYLLDEKTLGLWVNEQDNPYVEVKPYDWFRGYHVGGRSIMWGRRSFRLGDLDFEANLKEGYGVDWPIRYKDIAPWYSHVEKWIGVSGNRDGLDVLPDGEFLPPMEMNVVEKDMTARIKKHYRGKRHFIIARTANLTVPHNGRTRCQYQNNCRVGCIFGAYFSTQSSTLPAAAATGRLTLRPFSIVTRILYDKDLKKATGVEVLDAETQLTYKYFAKVIFVCASTLNSTWLLMNSAIDLWEGGLGSSSGELGCNLMDHHANCGAKGFVEGYENKYYYGRRPTGLYIPRFRNVGNDKRDYVRGFGYQGEARRSRRLWEVSNISIGRELKEMLSELGPWGVSFGGFGEILPYHENQIFLHKDQTDKWGLPVLAMNCELRENEKKMRIDMMEDCREMLEVAGATKVQTYDGEYTFGRCIHEMGTARMGRDPKTSVLNRNNQVWDALNVFVTDGACMTSSGCVNPSLTYMALTARAVDFAVNELKKLNL